MGTTTTDYRLRQGIEACISITASNSMAANAGPSSNTTNSLTLAPAIEALNQDWNRNSERLCEFRWQLHYLSSELAEANHTPGDVFVARRDVSVMPCLPLMHRIPSHNREDIRVAQKHE